MKTIEGVNYASKEAYTKFADEKKLSREDLQSVYESIAGAPKVKRLRNRLYAIERIWEISPVAQETPVAAPKTKRQAKAPKIPSDSKKAMVLRMLEGKGTTLDSIVAATGWAQHTTRGFISTLGSKGGYTIERTRENKVTTYRLIGHAEAA